MRGGRKQPKDDACKSTSVASDKLFATAMAFALRLIPASGTIDLDHDHFDLASDAPASQAAEAAGVARGQDSVGLDYSEPCGLLACNGCTHTHHHHHHHTHHHHHEVVRNHHHSYTINKRKYRTERHLRHYHCKNLTIVHQHVSACVHRQPLQPQAIGDAEPDSDDAMIGSVGGGFVSSSDDGDHGQEQEQEES